MAQRKKFYVVWNGYATGVFDSWEECQLQVKGYPDARYKSFDSQQAAVDAYRGDPAEHIGILKSIADHNRKPVVNYAAVPEINMQSIAVDAACSGNPGDMEYRGVWLPTGQELFRVGPLAGGTNNIGEYIAIVHALAMLDKAGRHDITIYSDSKTAQSWVRKGRANSNLMRTSANARVFELLARADAWLQAHAPRNPIVKWRTEEWGEIPADFGRK